MAEPDVLQVDRLEAQLSVIGSMLIDEKCVGLVLSRMTEDDFTDGTCRATFRAMRKLFSEGRPVDPVTVVDAMQGGEQYVQWAREAMELTPTAANVEIYAEIVRGQTALSRLKELGDRLSVATGLEEARKIVQESNGLLTGASRVERMTAAELAEDFIRRLTSREKPEYLPWGLPSADRDVYAEPGDMILLGGYPSSGKTLLSLQMALTQAAKYRVGYYTLETQPEKMADRIFARLAKLSLTAIKRRDLPETALARAAQAASLFATATPIDFIQASGLSVDDITTDAICRGYQVIYIDYLQLVEAPGVRSSDRYGTVTAVSRGLKVFAQRHKVAVVALSQLARVEKTGKDGAFVPPSMQSFRESGQIEQDADAAFLLWLQDPNDNRSDRILKLGKNKEGRKFVATLRFDGSTQTMEEVEKPPEDHSVAAQLAADGRAAKRANRALSGQVQFRELRGGDEDNPFVSP